jgi:hypothetical protein
MKTQSTSLFSAISKVNLVNLAAEVKETLAFGFTEKNNKILSAADVWNIQRQKRNRIQRRFSL